jgi:hypothetical protein
VHLLCLCFGGAGRPSLQGTTSGRAGAGTHELADARDVALAEDDHQRLKLTCAVMRRVCSRQGQERSIAAEHGQLLRGHQAGTVRVFCVRNESFCTPHEISTVHPSLALDERVVGVCFGLLCARVPQLPGEPLDIHLRGSKRVEQLHNMHEWKASRSD